MEVVLLNFFEILIPSVWIQLLYLYLILWHDAAIIHSSVNLIMYAGSLCITQVIHLHW